MIKALLIFPQADLQTGVYIKNALLQADCKVKVIDPRINYRGFIPTVKEWEPDFILCNRQVSLLNEIIYTRNNFPNTKIICWNLDKRNSVREFPKELLTLFDNCHIFYTIAAGNIEEYQRLCPNTIVKHLQEGIDPSIHKKEIITDEDHAKYDCDVMFAGDLNNPLHQGRKELFNFLLKQDLYIKIFGDKNDNKIINKEHNKACQCAKICIGHCGWKNIEISMSARDYRIMGAGGFLLTEHVKNIDKWFPVGMVCASYKSKEECLEKIYNYLINDIQRKRIADRGYKFVHKKHKFVDRIKTIIKDINNLCKD